MDESANSDAQQQQAAFSKRTRVCEAEDDQTAAQPAQVVKKVKLRDDGERLSAEAAARDGVGGGIAEGEVAPVAAGEQDNTAAPVNAVPSRGQAPQQAATPSASTHIGRPEQGGAAPKKSAALSGKQPTHTASRLRTEQSHATSSFYVSGVWWLLLIPTDPPPPPAGDERIYQVVRIPAPLGGPAPSRGLTTTFEPPLTQPDPTGSTLKILDGLLHYSFPQPLSASPCREERFKVQVRRTWTEQGKQMLMQHGVGQPRSSFSAAASAMPSKQQQQTRPPQIPIWSFPGRYGRRFVAQMDTSKLAEAASWRAVAASMRESAGQMAGAARAWLLVEAARMEAVAERMSAQGWAIVSGMAAIRMRGQQEAHTLAHLSINSSSSTTTTSPRAVAGAAFLSTLNTTAAGISRHCTEHYLLGGPFPSLQD